MTDFSNFYWGTSNEWYKEIVIREFSHQNIYLRFFGVEEGEIVVDFGSSIGPFSFSIKDKNPSIVYCIEPSYEQIPTLEKNLEGLNFVIIPRGISNIDGLDDFEVYGSINQVQRTESIRFKTILEKYKIEKIDFLKTDCEGGEYNIFDRENIWWIKENVRKIAGEWHLESLEQKEKFREFRDIYLKLFPNHKVYSVDGIDIGWELWSEKFIEYYNQVIIYIDNR